MAFVFVGVSGSSAIADVCLTAGGGGGTHVGKGFTIPQPNTCSPFNGFEIGAGLEGAITGTGCTDVNGGTFILHYAYHSSSASGEDAGSYFESGLCRFRFQSGTFPDFGRCRGTVLTSPDNHGSLVVDAQLSDCGDVPVPEGTGP